MKQILRTMKWNHILSELPKLLLILCVCGGVLLLQNETVAQLLNITPSLNDPKTELVMGILMKGLLVAAIAYLLYLFSGHPQKQAKTFIKQLSPGEQEMLAIDFQNAWRGSRIHRIGSRYTYLLDSAFCICRNSDIIWLYPWSEGSPSAINKHFYFNLYLIDKEEPNYIGTTEKSYQRIMEYYERNFSHIIVGNSDEASYWYRNDREKFLDLKYNASQNQTE